MTGRRLYEKYTDALYRTERTVWRDGRTVRTYPKEAPLAWAFAGQAIRDIFNVLARMITPKPRPKAPAQIKITGYRDQKKIQAIKGVRAVTNCSLFDAKTQVDGLDDDIHTTFFPRVGLSVADALKILDEHGVVYAS